MPQPPLVDISPDHADKKQEQLQLLAELRKRLAGITHAGPAQLAAIVVAPKHNIHDLIVEARVLPGVGVEGDRPMKQFWRGRRQPGRQISAINAEVLDALGVDYSVPGDNLIIRGFDLETIQPGEAIKVGDAILIATGVPHRPCKLFRDRTSTAHYAAISPGRLRGTMFDALDAATMRLGDTVERIQLNGHL